MLRINFLKNLLGSQVRFTLVGWCLIRWGIYFYRVVEVA
jgi:hypothetical protein